MRMAKAKSEVELMQERFNILCHALASMSEKDFNAFIKKL